MNKGEFATFAADVLFDELKNKLCWSDGHRRWMVWDSKRWVPTTAFKVHLEVSETLQKYWWDKMSGYLAMLSPTNSDPSPEFLQNLTDLITHATENLVYIKTAIRLLRTLDGFQIVKGRWDNNRYLLNVRNGTIDMKTCILHPHDPTDLLTRLAPTEFVHDAKAPKWEKHLEHCLPDVSDRFRMQRNLGRALVSADLTGVRPLWYGSGNDGKYFTARVLQHVLGDHVHTGWFPELATEKGANDWRPSAKYLPHTHWPNTLPKTYRGRTDEVMAKLLTESSGILWWLLNGVSSWLRYGFF